MDLKRTPTGKWELRWRDAGRGSRRMSRTFALKKDAVAFETDRLRRKQLGHVSIPDDITFETFTETYWRLHAVPNLAVSTRAYYKHNLNMHIIPRLGEYTVRELSPRRMRRFREDLEHAGVGVATIRKSMAIVQSILSFAIAEEVVEFNAAAAVRKPRYSRARAPHIFLPLAVEEIRSRLALRDATLVATLAYSGARPEEVVCRLKWGDVGDRAIHYLDQKRHQERYTPLLAALGGDLRQWFMASGRPAAETPVFPTTTGGFWSTDDWRNWRRRVWAGERERIDRRHPNVKRKVSTGAAPAGTRPRDLRSSYITVRVYEGVPLTQIAKEVGTSIAMIERHYAGVIENWDGQRIPADTQIQTAREGLRRSA